MKHMSSLWYHNYGNGDTPVLSSVNSSIESVTLSK